MKKKKNWRILFNDDGDGYRIVDEDGNVKGNYETAEEAAIYHAFALHKLLSLGLTERLPKDFIVRPIY